MQKDTFSNLSTDRFSRARSGKCFGVWRGVRNASLLGGLIFSMLAGTAWAAGFEDDNPLLDEIDEAAVLPENSNSGNGSSEEIDETLLSDSIESLEGDSDSGFFFPAFYAGAVQNNMPVAPPAVGNTSLWAYDFGLKFGYKVFESNSLRAEFFITGLLSYPIRIRDEVGRPLLEIGGESGGIFRFMPFEANFLGLSLDGDLLGSLSFFAAQVQHARHLLTTMDPVLGVGLSIATQRVAFLARRALYLDAFFKASHFLGGYRVNETKPIDRSDLAFVERGGTAWNTRGKSSFYEYGFQLATQISSGSALAQVPDAPLQGQVSSRLGLQCSFRQRVYDSFLTEEETKRDARRMMASIGFVWERRLNP